jgi:hypothetical protein
MRDGTTVSGTIVSTSPGEVRITGNDNVTRTIPMSQVRSIDYGEAQPPAAANAPAGAAAPSGSAPPPAPEGAPDPVHERHRHPEPSAITTQTYNLAAGTDIKVRTEETIDSKRAVEGQTYAAEIASDVRDAAGNVVIPRGANATLVIKSASKGGRFRGASDLVLDLAEVSVGGQQYRLNTADVVERGRQGVGVNRRTGEFAGGGAAVGAIIGAIAGHGTGAAIGAASGAGAGALTEILTKGSIKVPAESVLTFRLESPLRVVAAQ